MKTSCSWTLTNHCSPILRSSTGLPLSPESVTLASELLIPHPGWEASATLSHALEMSKSRGPGGAGTSRRDMNKTQTSKTPGRQEPLSW